MVKWHDFTIESVRTVLFTPDHSSFVGGRVVATMLREFGERFDGDMEVLPRGVEFPPEVPRVQLQSKDNAFWLEAAPASFSLIWSRTDSVKLDLANAVNRCLEVLTYYVNESSVRVGRLGMLVQRVCPDQNPAQTLIQRFCTEESQSEPFNRSSTFEIHNHKQYQPVRDSVDYEINSWVRCRCGTDRWTNSPAIMVTQDLNTIASEAEKRNFNSERIRLFFLMATAEAETIITKYFPDRG